MKRQVSFVTAEMFGEGVNRHCWCASMDAMKS